MQINSVFFFALLIMGVGLILFSMKKCGRFFSAFFLSVLQGVAALFAVNLITSITGVSLAVNWVSLAISAVGGVCGVIGMLIMNFLVYT
ncbi:MAG: pro-sigmaK processing inhibitor BofA family protein [Clostridia bacterium]